MSDASELWAAVKNSYDEASLISLTNINNPSATSINDTVGEDAAQTVINLWPLYAEVSYDSTDDLHVEIAKRGVIAVLWSRGGTATSISKVEWEDVFGPNGLLNRLRNISPRSRQAPASNSGVSQKSETVNGSKIRGWSERCVLPDGILPEVHTADD